MTGDILVGAAKPVRDALDYWTGYATVGGAIILAFYTGAAFWQAILTRRAIREARESTEKNNKIARDALVLGRRAWVVIHGIPVFKGAQGWTFEDVKVENISDMPAIIRGFDTGRVKGDPDNLSLRESQRISSDVLIRDCRIGLDFQPVPPPPFNMDDHVSHWHEVQNEAIFCIVWYTDCFKEEWSTTICWRSGPDGWDRYHNILK